MKKNKIIYFVYAGTQGSAGLYLNAILQTFSKYNISQYSFVSFYYPFSNAKRIFYRYTDLASGRQKNKLRPFLRYFELIYALLRIFLKTLINRPVFLNYSLNSSYFPEYLFLICIRKILGVKIVLTCHDVIPFQNCYLKSCKENDRRTNLFRMADFLLVHNDNSKIELINYYGIKPEKIVFHSFPVMDLRLLGFPYVFTKKIDFLFIGHLRPEKGIKILLEAWKMFYYEYPMANLYIVGNNPSNSGININEYRDLNITFILNYVDDKTYIEYIASAKCVVLPYLRGTNSGIPSSVYSLGTDLIVSDIPMFQNNQLIDSRAFFESGNSYKLRDKMIDFYKISNSINFCQKIEMYKEKFDKEVSQLYMDLMNL